MENRRNLCKMFLDSNKMGQSYFRYHQNTAVRKSFTSLCYKLSKIIKMKNKNKLNTRHHWLPSGAVHFLTNIIHIFLMDCFFGGGRKKRLQRAILVKNWLGCACFLSFKVRIIQQLLIFFTTISQWMLFQSTVPVRLVYTLRKYSLFLYLFEI